MDGQRFAGRTVIVTGAASGIGRASALLFAREGAHVFAADIDSEGGKALAASSGGGIVFRQCDVTDTEAIRGLMDHAAAKTGGIDTVFNNAGAGGAHEAIDEIEPAGWDATMALLLRSVAFGIRYAVPHMIGRPGASIVNTASVAATGPGYSPTAYAVAKSGVQALSKAAAADLAKHGIRVNAVLPGFIETGIFTASLGLTGENLAKGNAIVAELARQAQPVARAGRADDIAKAVAYLASEDAAFVTGTSLLVDGGLTIGPRHSWDDTQPDLFEALRALENAGDGAR